MCLTDLSIFLACLLPVIRHDLDDRAGKCEPVVSHGSFVRALTGAGLDLECDHIMELLCCDTAGIGLRINRNIAAHCGFYLSFLCRSLLYRCFCCSFFRRSLFYFSRFLDCGCFLCRSGFLCCRSCLLGGYGLLCRRRSFLCCCRLLGSCLRCYFLLCFFLLCTFTHNDAPPFPHWLY